MKVSRWGGRLGLCCLLTLIFLWSCRRENPSNFDRNLPPETVITGAPAESTQSFYQIHVFWHGEDPDGLVDHFEYSVTDSNKTPGEDDPNFSGYFQTTRTDSVFRMTANKPQILGHRFYVRAVDNEGKTDPTPAWTYFLAFDTNPPEVVFHLGVGTWIDRAGNMNTIQLTSDDVNNPTDTIGVGGSIAVTWGGFDRDVGGSVVGFEHRTTQDPRFVGGTLADTARSISFAETAGGDLTSYFSGDEAILVKAIDDAGARTQPDAAARSVVVNFSPITWIIDPNQTSPPVRKRVFTQTSTQAVWPSGTTLADGLVSIQFKYTGFDDARDMSLDPNNPSGISVFQFRRLENRGGLAYKDIENWNAFPQVSDFNNTSTLNLDSGDYIFLVRAVDELGRLGKPDTIKVNINYSPYFEWVSYLAPDSSVTDLWLGTSPQSPPVTIALSPDSTGGYPDFDVFFFARDDHKPPPDQHPADFNAVVEEELGVPTDYFVKLNGSSSGLDPAPVDSLGAPIPDTRSFPVTQLGGGGVIGPGQNTFDLAVRDNSGRIIVITVVFLITLL